MTVLAGTTSIMTAPTAGNRAQSRLLPDGRRLHLHDGPIDLIIEAFGESSETEAAYAQAESRFATILDELCDELSRLRRPGTPVVFGPTARRMVDATGTYEGVFVTPMAAVAGAVADEVLCCLVATRKLSRAYVNNGGDIAVYLAPGERLKIAGHANSRIVLAHDSPTRGIATSGWRGRSHSLGIADAVTVLAASAAEADVAATLIANATDTDHPGVCRAPADTLAPDSDLGSRLVTTYVPELATAEIEEALNNGLSAALDLHKRGLIHSASLTLQSKTWTTEG